MQILITVAIYLILEELVFIFERCNDYARCPSHWVSSNFQSHDILMGHLSFNDWWNLFILTQTVSGKCQTICHWNLMFNYTKPLKVLAPYELMLCPKSGSVLLFSQPKLTLFIYLYINCLSGGGKDKNCSKQSK